LKKDIISKDVLITLIKDISKHILHLGVEISSIELISSENNRIEQRRADVVAKINDKFILHLEIQNGNDKNMHLRMLRYFLDIKTLTELPIKQYVVYIGKPKLSMKDSLIEENIRYKYNIIDMKEIDCEILLKKDTPDALVLAILCDFKDKKPKDVVKYIIDRLLYHTKSNPNEYRKYLLMLEELSTNRDLKEVVKEQEMLSELNYEKYPSYEIGLEKGLEKGIEKGMEKGIEKGLEKGVIEGKKFVAKSLLKIHDEQTVAKLTGLDIQTIKDLKSE